jgi:exodeoxyribonuclease V alpha subunit
LQIAIDPKTTLEPSNDFQAATAKEEALSPEPAASIDSLPKLPDDPVGDAKKKHESFALDIALNAKQELAANFAENGKCFVLTGAAGTGKTTGCREIAKRLLKHGKLGQHDFKLRGGGRVLAPSIAFCAYTNRASNNMRRALHKDPHLEEILEHNITTIHRLLEYEPVFFEREDGSTGMRFEPMRHSGKPLRITHLIIEESSMLGIDLWLKLLDALLPGTQIIFVGDINQLPPVFSKSILNYALINLPVVELDEVYRQALDSPIIENAHHCLKGETLREVKPFFRVVQAPNLKKIPSESYCVNMLVNSLKKWNTVQLEDGSMEYDPEQDIVLSPYNKNDAGTVSLNNHIAQFLGQKRNAMVYEIIAGIRKLYLAEGDRVMVDKQDGHITKITHNARYIGRMPMPASTELTRFGMRLLGSSSLKADEDFELQIEGYEHLSVDSIPDDDEKRKQEASHFVEVTLDDGRLITLNTAGDFGENVFSLGYALTVHKAQGCEWRKVIFLIHKNHATLLSRELIYTAMTRAREYFIAVDLCNYMQKGISTQRVKGNSVQEKIEWFNSEVSLNEPVPVIP